MNIRRVSSAALALVAAGLGLSSFARAAAPASAPAVKIGYCSDDLEQAKAAGFDYAELGVRNFTALSDEAFRAFLARRDAVGLPTPVGYLFLPPDMKVVGPDTDEAKEMAYVRTAFTRAQALGIGTIVFGSGPARTAPEGFPKDKAMAQLVAFAKRIAPEARRHRIVLCVEAQRTQETNLVNTTAEAIDWVRAVGDPNFQVMVDFYHLASMKEDPSVLPRAGHIAHVHFANPDGRVFPLAAGEYDYSAFFANLRKTSYPGRISIEAKTANLAAEGPKAVAFLREAATHGVAAPVAAAAPRASDAFVCTEVLGVSVTGDWFGAGFETGLDDARWQVRWRSHAFVELWADPASDLWAMPAQSPCAQRSDDPDRVIFTAVNWDYTTQAEWEAKLEAVVATLRVKRPGARRLELMTMLRAPGNRTCGSVMTVVQPYVDAAIAAVAARHSGLVVAAPKVEIETCAPFVDGGPHYTDAGKAAVAAAYRKQLVGR
jgi:D-psicose/D-tagatose/L-ribulose 3-epimerase